jgi:Protein of unknown function (DUF2997)
MQQVEIIIDGGTPTIKVRGCKGKSCKDLTRGLEAALGEVDDSKPTAEFYEQAKQTTKASR